jgi:hypothetical protein
MGTMSAVKLDFFPRYITTAYVRTEAETELRVRAARAMERALWPETLKTQAMVSGAQTKTTV